MVMSRDESLERMAELLRRGATLLDVQCPLCNTPLFRLSSGEMYCSTCQKMVVKEEKELLKTTHKQVITSLNKTVCQKIEELDSLIFKEKDQEKISVLLKNLVTWLDALERIRRLEKM